MGHRIVPTGDRTVRQTGHEKQEAQKRAGHENDGLHRIAPHHGDNPAEHRVNNDRHPREQNDPVHFPAEQQVHRQSHQKHDRSHARQLREQIADPRINSRPRPEPRLEMAVSRDLAGRAVIRHEPPRRDPQRDGQRQTEDKSIPIPRKGASGQGEKTDTAHIGRQNRQPDHPSRHRAVRFGEPRRGRTPPRAVKIPAHTEHGGKVKTEHHPVDQRERCRFYHLNFHRSPF